MYGHAVPSFLKVTSDEKNWLTLHLKMLVSWLLLKMRVACLLGWYNDFSTFLVTEVKQACSQWGKKVLLCILIPDPLFIKHHWNVCTIFFFPLLSFSSSPVRSPIYGQSYYWWLSSELQMEVHADIPLPLAWLLAVHSYCGAHTESTCFRPLCCECPCGL